MEHKQGCQQFSIINKKSEINENNVKLIKPNNYNLGLNMKKILTVKNQGYLLFRFMMYKLKFPFNSHLHPFYQSWHPC